MAHVPISNALLGAVHMRINELRNAEMRTVSEQPPIHVTHAEIEDFLWRGYTSLKDQIPDLWKTSVRQLQVMVLDEKATPVFHQYAHLSNPVLGPPRIEPTVYQIPPSDPRAATYIKWHKEREEIHNAWNERSAAVQKFLTGCKSLNEALKLMPEITAYIRSDYLQRVEQKVERKKSESTAKAPDEATRESLISGYVVARMAGLGDQ